ncbi:Uncharacterised protein [Shigella sonnei]|nr:Uncharacterised protein [Shigella sonnei]
MAVDRLRCENREAAGHHGGNAAGHRKAAIVRFCGHQQGKRVIAVDRVLVKSARFVAGDRQVIALGYKLICQFHGGDAFRAVAGSTEGDQQQRMSWIQVVHRIGDQIGGRYGAEVFTGMAGEPRRDDVTDKCRRSGSGQDDPQILFAQ